MGEGEHEHEMPPVVAPVVAPVESVTDHTIDHAAKIATLEGKLTQQEEAFYRRLNETEDQLRRAIEEGGRGSQERIAALEAKLDEMTAAVVKPAEEIPGAVDFEVPPVESSPAPPEKTARGIRARRKARRTKQ